MAASNGSSKTIDNLSINTIRTLSMDAVQQANSGHPGTPMALAPVVYWVTSGLFEAMGNINQLPATLAAWSPDVIFALASGYLVLKTPS